ncbi:MAG: tRNA (cytidine(34)-2'-O)-methyltransferase [Anaerovoracaceae bacterium]
MIKQNVDNPDECFHIVLVEPEIPPNTGNVARTCAATGTRLHLIRPMGFEIDNTKLKRAGLDYWPKVALEIHENLDAFMKKYGHRKLYLATTHGERIYNEVSYEPGCMFLFGRETRGLPKELVRENRERTVRIPMSKAVGERSLNLSNSVAIMIFEALRQQGFPNME